MSYDKEQINDEAKNYYEKLFEDHIHYRSNFHDLEMTSLSVKQSIMLENPFSEEEVKSVIWNFGSNKSPGPDGYTMEFFKAVCDIIKI